MDHMTRIVNGVRVAVVDYESMFTIQDIATILGRNAISLIASVPAEHRRKAEVSGWTVTSSDRLMWTMDETALVAVAELVAGDAKTEERRRWVVDWCRDLANSGHMIAGGDTSAPRYPIGFKMDSDLDSDSIAEAVFPEITVLRREPKSSDAEMWMNAEAEVRGAAKSVATSLGMYIDALGDAETFIDGMVAGTRISGGRDLSDLLHDMHLNVNVALDGMQRAQSELAEIAGEVDG